MAQSLDLKKFGVSKYTRRMKCLNKTLVFILVIYSITVWMQLKIFLVKKFSEISPPANNTAYHMDHVVQIDVHGPVPDRHNKYTGKPQDKEDLEKLKEEINSDVDIGDIELPGAIIYLPHLKGHPEYLRPAIQLSKGRTGVALVIGVPTVNRRNMSYLDSTLRSLFTNLPPQDAAQCLIIVFIAEPWNMSFLREVTLNLQLNYPVELLSGLLEVMAPTAKYYPDLESLPLTLNDDKERVKWRTKQNLDYAFLMLHAYKRGQYYIQLEDDIITRPDFFTAIMNACLTRSGWTVIHCSTLGFIGKVLKTSDLPILIEFLIRFHWHKPGDWLLVDFLKTIVCTKDIKPKECDAAVNKISLDIQPPLFQHMGLQSSLKGKIQPLKEKNFNTNVPQRNNDIHIKKNVSGGTNPPAKYIITTIDQFENYSIDGVYRGETTFWGYTPFYGDNIDILYDPPIKLYSYKIVSGSKDHPDDIFPASTSILVLTDSLNNNTNQADNYYVLGNFSSQGAVQGQINVNISYVKVFRIHLNENMKTWIFIKEITISTLTYE